MPWATGPRWQVGPAIWALDFTAPGHPIALMGAGTGRARNQLGEPDKPGPHQRSTLGHWYSHNGPGPPQGQGGGGQVMPVCQLVVTGIKQQVLLGSLVGSAYRSVTSLSQGLTVESQVHSARNPAWAVGIARMRGAP